MMPATQELQRTSNGTTPRAKPVDPTIAALGSILRELRGEMATARAEAQIEVASLRAELASLRAEAASGSRAPAAPAIANAEVVTDENDPRSFTLVLWQSDGAAHRCRFVLPIPLHQGRFEPSRKYTLNDLVAHEGCSWIARRATQNEEPGHSAAWYLSSKQGKRGPPGDAAPPPRTNLT